MPIWFLVIIIASLLVAILGLWLLASWKNPQGLGIHSMFVGAIGIIVPLYFLIANSSLNVLIALLNAGAIVFGCGVIATTIAKNKQ